MLLIRDTFKTKGQKKFKIKKMGKDNGRISSKINLDSFFSISQSKSLEQKKTKTVTPLIKMLNSARKGKNSKTTIKIALGVPVGDWWVKNPTNLHGDVGVTPDLAQWIKGSGFASSFSEGRGCGLDLALVWLWCGPVAMAVIQPLAWEPLYAVGVALKRHTPKNSLNYI